MHLKDKTCKAADHTDSNSKVPIKLPDGEGLFLFVMPKTKKQRAKGQKKL